MIIEISDTTIRVGLLIVAIIIATIIFLKFGFMRNNP